MKELCLLTVASLLVSLYAGVASTHSSGHQNADQSGERIYEASEVDRRAKITKKPAPPFTEEARKNRVSGRVVLRVVLEASGEIGGIEVIEELPDGLTEECIKVARQIKFEPAMKDDHAVSQYFKADYYFTAF